jgi:hypothetical protein
MVTKTLTKTRKESKAENGATKTCHKILDPLQDVDFPYECGCEPMSYRGKSRFRLVFSGLPEKTALEIMYRVASLWEDPQTELEKLLQPLAEAQAKSRSEN